MDLKMSTRFGAEALARVTSVPPDPEFGHPERVAWRTWVARLAFTLDLFHARGEGDGLGCRVLGDAFRLFLPLADPGWWCRHPTVRLNAAARRELRTLEKKTRRGGRWLWAGTLRAQMVRRLSAAAAVFLRRGDGEGLARCHRLTEVMDGQRLPDAEAFGRAPGGVVRPGIFHHGGGAPGGRRHDAGPGDVRGPGKEIGR